MYIYIYICIICFIIIFMMNILLYKYYIKNQFTINFELIYEIYSFKSLTQKKINILILLN